jgi:hypothetical protein
MKAREIWGKISVTLASAGFLSLTLAISITLSGQWVLDDLAKVAYVFGPTCFVFIGLGRLAVLVIELAGRWSVKPPYDPHQELLDRYSKVDKFSSREKEKVIAPTQDDIL